MTAHAPHAEFNIPEAALLYRVQTDLLAEAVEILIAEAAPVLTAIRHDDEDAIVERFKRLDLAFRMAKACAIDIRDGIARRRS